MECFILIPSFDSTFEKEEGECLLASDHSGYHLNKLRSGQYLSWGGNGCDDDCNWCGECFCWIELSEAEARAIILDPSKNNDD